MKIQFWCFSLILIIYSVFACNPPIKEFDFGKIENNVYSNSFFKVKIPINESWHLQNKETLESYREVIKNLISGNNTELKKKLDSSINNCVDLLVLFKHKLSSKVRYNPSIFVMIKKINENSKINTVEDYFDFDSEIYYNSHLNYIQLDSGNYKKVNIDDKEFKTMSHYVNYAKIDIYKKTYAAIIKEFYFIISISYNTKEHEKELFQIIDNIDFFS